MRRAGVGGYRLLFYFYSVLQGLHCGIPEGGEERGLNSRCLLRSQRFRVAISGESGHVLKNAAEPVPAAGFHRYRPAIGPAEFPGQVRVKARATYQPPPSGVFLEPEKSPDKCGVDGQDILHIPRLQIDLIGEVCQQKLHRGPFVRGIKGLQFPGPASRNATIDITVGVDEFYGTAGTGHVSPQKHLDSGHQQVPGPDPVVSPRRGTGDTVILDHTGVHQFGNNTKELFETGITCELQLYISRPLPGGLHSPTGQSLVSGHSRSPGWRGRLIRK
ncbi:MAG: hypothetical protein WBG01_12910, partial [Bacteroidota bacterium]